MTVSLRLNQWLNIRFWVLSPPVNLLLIALILACTLLLKQVFLYEIFLIKSAVPLAVDTYSVFIIIFPAFVYICTPPCGMFVQPGHGNEVSERFVRFNLRFIPGAQDILFIYPCIILFSVMESKPRYLEFMGVEDPLLARGPHSPSSSVLRESRFKSTYAVMQCTVVRTVHVSYLHSP